eukprot:CAMPEP_0181021976 /NCGR_PEP_ID=MMETSP1070-20121207/1271_1 /TAXON_ID=265543 /ORGANISM="Minutocellus polymorphus, Strain NH13" /LENGTH=895 /DNA_ID=CAMNT_0023098893 /DNA_START=490 /DNA_END=3178 /DNA_ORIENTATION=+
MNMERTPPWFRVQAALAQNHTSESPTIRQIRQDVAILQATVQQFQQDQNHDVATSSQVDECVSSLKGQVLNLQREVASSATRTQLKQVEESIQRLKAETERLVGDSQASFRTEVDDCVEEKLTEIQSWFKELEKLMRQRQAMLDARMASVAKSGDLVVLQSTVERESADMAFDAIGHTTDAVALALSHIRYNMAIAALTRLRRSATLRLLRRAWKAWAMRQKESNEARKRFLLQSRLTRKVLTQIMLRRKRIGFTKWVELVESQKRVEARKRAAIELMQQRIIRSMTQPIQRAFFHWRRVVLVDKISATGTSSRKRLPVPVASGSDSSAADAQQYHIGPSGASQSDLSLVLEGLKNDAHGSAQALAQEIRNIREHDIGGLRTQWDDEKAMQADSIGEMTKSSLKQLTARQDEFEGCVQSTVEGLTTEFPSIQSKVTGLESSHSALAAKTAATQNTHNEQLDILSERNDLLDERLKQLESRLIRADEHIRSLEEDGAKSNQAIDLLQRQMKSSEQQHASTEAKMQHIVRRFAVENTELRQRLQATENNNGALSEELHSTQAILEKQRASTQNALDRIRGVLDAHGVCKPKLVKMIQLCVLYEKTAKEKNYVVSIDTVFDGNDAANLPDNIAAFSHDYALWIAYQADHEVLQRAVARTQSNQHDLVYADDDLGPRRLELLEGLKSDLCLALEAVHSEAGLLKLEARTRFVNRLMEATDSALSKHDQIVIETNSRIGKLRSSNKSVPVCVACDRPLRSRRRANGDGAGAGGQQARKGRDLPSEVASGEVSDGPDELMVGSATTSRVATMGIKTPKRSNQRSNTALDEGKAYTMRCGFKIPLVDNSSCGSPSSSIEGKGYDGVGQEGNLNHRPESDNAKPNTSAGSGKRKAILRQMSLP